MKEQKICYLDGNLSPICFDCARKWGEQMDYLADTLEAEEKDMKELFEHQGEARCQVCEEVIWGEPDPNYSPREHDGPYGRII